jgi:hypothetical protein
MSLNYGKYSNLKKIFERLKVLLSYLYNGMAHMHGIGKPWWETSFITRIDLGLAQISSMN